MESRARAFAAVLGTSSCWTAAMACAQPLPDISPQPSGADSATAASARTLRGAAVTALDTQTRGWQVGVRNSYRLHLTTVVDIGPGPHSFDFDVDGNIEVSPIKVSGDGAAIYERVVGATIVSRAGRQSEFNRIASEMVDKGCVFTLSEGKLTELRFPKAMSAMAANAYRQIASGLQFSAPTHGVDHYVTEEYDTTGQYVATYEFDGKEGLWRRHKERYLAVLGATSVPGIAVPPIVPEVRASSGRVRLSAEGRPVVVESHEELGIKGAQAPVHTRTDLVLESRPTGDAAGQSTAPYDALVASMDRIGADQPYGPPVAVEALDDARIHGLTFEKVLARFEQLAPHEKDMTHGPVNGTVLEPADRAKGEAQTEERSRLFVALAAIFRQHPETVALALTRIRGKSPASTVLIDALGSASSAQSQAALAELLQSEKLDPTLRRQVLLALSRTPRPDQTSVDALKMRLASDPFDTQALYGLGTYSRRLRDRGDSQGASELGEFLLSRFSLVRGPSQLLTLLGAIANSGYAPALAKLGPYLSHEQEPVRAAAVHALQSIRDPEADKILAAHVESDASSDVRVSAIEAARVREPTEVLERALVNAATNASDAQVRYRSVETIALWMQKRTELRSTLEQVAKKDSEERVRSRARAAL